MRVDLPKELGATVREVRRGERNGRPVRAVVAARVFDTDIDDAWDALTSPERIPRWFLPVHGELHAGGRYQLEGNASGEIVTCEAPHHLEVTWEFGGKRSWVEVRLTQGSKGRTLVELQHIVPVDEHWEKFGAGAVGLGWELALSGLARHLSTAPHADHAEAMAWSQSDEGKAFIRSSCEAWAGAAIAGGENEGEARAAAGRTGAFYLDEPGA